MPIDITTFRSIAAQSPDRLVYVSGEKLKSAKTQGSRGPEVFKAAVDAFIKAYGDHYGAKLGNMSRQSLQGCLEHDRTFCRHGGNLAEDPFRLPSRAIGRRAGQGARSPLSPARRIPAALTFRPPRRDGRVTRPA